MTETAAIEPRPSDVKILTRERIGLSETKRKIQIFISKESFSLANLSVKKRIKFGLSINDPFLIFSFAIATINLVNSGSFII